MITITSFFDFSFSLKFFFELLKRNSFSLFEFFHFSRHFITFENLVPLEIDPYHNRLQHGFAFIDFNTTIFDLIRTCIFGSDVSSANSLFIDSTKVVEVRTVDLRFTTWPQFHHDFYHDDYHTLWCLIIL